MNAEFNDSIMCTIDILLELAEMNEDKQKGLSAAVFVLSSLLKDDEVQVEPAQPEEPLIIPSFLPQTTEQQPSEDNQIVDLEPTLFKTRLDKATRAGRQKQAVVMRKYWSSKQGESRRSGTDRLEQLADQAEQESKRVRSKRK